MADRQVSDKSLLLETAMNNMTQGVVMFDANERLVVCNDRYMKCTDCRPVETRLLPARCHSQADETKASTVARKNIAAI